MAEVRHSGRPLVTFLNRYDATLDLHRRNLEWLRTRQGLEVIVDLEALAERVRSSVSR
ncbi:MAG: hypothetical protein ACR2MB_04245 [Acidimicrobiales bacterium]